MEINEQLQPAAGGPGQDEEILCIEVYSRGYGSLLPVEKVETVAAFPVVAELPESRKEIIGIGRYGNSVVPYYEISCRECRDQKAGDIRCGIIMRTADGYIGIAADEVSEEKQVQACEYEEQIPEHLRWALGGKEV